MKNKNESQTIDTLRLELFRAIEHAMRDDLPKHRIVEEIACAMVACVLQWDVDYLGIEHMIGEQLDEGWAEPTVGIGGYCPVVGDA